MQHVVERARSTPRNHRTPEPREAREHLLALVDDADLRGRIGDAARLYVERERSMTVMARQWANVLHEVAAPVPLPAGSA